MKNKSTIDKRKVIEKVEEWLKASGAKFGPSHGSWEQSVVIEEEWIKVHFDEVLDDGVYDRMRIIPLTDYARKEFEGYTIDLDLKDISSEYFCIDCRHVVDVLEDEVNHITNGLCSVCYSPKIIRRT